MVHLTPAKQHSSKIIAAYMKRFMYSVLIPESGNDTKHLASTSQRIRFIEKC